MFPTITPSRISISATEMPSRMEIRLASNARPIQNAAMNQMFSIIGAPSNLRLFQVRVRPIVNYPRLFQRDQAALHHLIEHRQESPDVLLAIHNLYDQGQVH